MNLGNLRRFRRTTLNSLNYSLTIFAKLASLNLGGELKHYILEILLRQRQRVARIGKEDVAAMLIDSHVSMLASLEIGKLRLIFGLNPTRLVNRYWFLTTLCTILMLQTILDNLEL